MIESGAEAVSTRLSCQVALPANFRAIDTLRFHHRDAQGVAEQVDASSMRKGMSWQGHPACLSIAFNPGYAQSELLIDGPSPGLDAEALRALLLRMLGLTQAVECFEQTYLSHPQLGQLIQSARGLRVPLAATPFEALTWAVTGQQISVHAAVALRRKLILAAGARHSGGLGCYPDAAQLRMLGVEALRQAGFSCSKAETLIRLSEAVADGSLPLDAWLTAMPPTDEIRQRLLQIRGIGPWTVGYGLLRGYGWLDGSLHGDAAVRRGLQSLLARQDKMGEQETEGWLAEFSPWRALVAAHLWALNQRASQ